MWVYRSDPHPILALVNAGYAVLAFDQAGFGSRMGEFAPFYKRHPHWSLMGRMVEDTTRAVDALAADAAIDPARISVFGYTIGGTVGLYAAALDPRIKSVVSISGFTPMRTDTADRGTGGLARYSEERALLPRLGFFIGNESRLPYDFDELIAAIAPRPVLVVEPTMDRATTPADVRQAVVARETGLQPVLRLRQAHPLRTGRLHTSDQRHAGLGGPLDESDPRSLAGARPPK